MPHHPCRRTAVMLFKTKTEGRRGFICIYSNSISEGNGTTRVRTHLLCRRSPVLQQLHYEIDRLERIALQADIKGHRSVHVV